MFEFALRPAQEKPDSKAKVEEKDEPEPKDATAEQPRSAGPGYKVAADPSGGLTVEVPLDWEAETGEAAEGGDGAHNWAYYAVKDITA